MAERWTPENSEIKPDKVIEVEGFTLSVFDFRPKKEEESDGR